MLDEIKKILLLGTDRKELEATDLPNEIQSACQALETENKTEDLLQLVTLVQQYQTAGQVPESFEGTWTERDTTLPASALPEALQNVLDQYTRLDHPLRRDLFLEWLTIVEKGNYFLPPKAIIRLVEIAKSFPNQTFLKRRIFLLLDENKLKCLEGTDLLHQVNLASNKEMWEEEATAKRTDLLKKMIAYDAEQILSLIQSTWEGESIRFKRTIVNAIEESKNPIFLDFLSHLFDTEFQFKAKEKKSTREIRELLVKALLFHGSEPIVKQAVVNIEQSIQHTEAKKLIGLSIGKGSYSWNLKGSCWERQTILETFGFLAESDNQNVNVRAWIRTIVSTIPFQQITNLLSIESKEFMKLCLELNLLNEDRGRLLRYLGNERSTILIGQIDNHQGNEEICDFLMQQDKERYGEIVPYFASVSYFEKQTFTKAKEIPSSVLQKLHEFETEHNCKNKKVMFSKKYSIQIVEGIFEKRDQYFHSYDFAKQLLFKLHPDVLPLLEKQNEQTEQTADDKFWRHHFYSVIKAEIESRDLLSQY